MKTIANTTFNTIRQPANWVIAACFGLCVFSTARWLDQQPIALTPTADAAEITPQLDVPQSATETNSKTVLTPIENLEVGMRVRADSPNGEIDDQFGAEVIPSEWRKLTLTSPKKNGTLSHITLLRPLEWIEREKAVVDGHVYITVPECGIDGNARVHTIEPCPEIPDGEGQVITGTFRHQAEGGVELTIEGEPEPIRCTGNHPFWSEDRKDFVRADTLKPLERLRTPLGLVQIRESESFTGQPYVFNIEVFGSHVYHVGGTGLLVHNGTACSKLLGENLEAAGFARPPGTITLADERVIVEWEAAHIVPGGMADIRAADARDALERAGIDINDVKNGFWAKKRHAGTHSDAYLDRLGELLNKDTAPEDVAGNLEILWGEIEAGTWMKWVDKYREWR